VKDGLLELLLLLVAFEGHKEALEKRGFRLVGCIWVLWYIGSVSTASIVGRRGIGIFGVLGIRVGLVGVVDRGCEVGGGGLQKGG